ncbi:MAG: hypothetical protein M3415_05930 [Actinomycetota bacterium]|nr:hypothetical protein [Actinomycetota bacterium]
MAAGCRETPAGTLARVQATTLRVGMVSEPPWTGFEGGEPTGIEVDLVRELARDVGSEVEWGPG